MQSKQIKFIAEAGVMLALGLVLDKVKLYQMPQAGSVTLGQMLPCFLIAYKWGLGRGILVGAIFGVLQWLLGGYVIGFAQGFIDYPLAFGLLGIAGLASKKLNEAPVGKAMPTALAAAAIGGILRYFCHVATGVIFFYEYAGEKNPFVYSIGYNVATLVDTVVCMILIAAIFGAYGGVMKKWLADKGRA